MPSVYYSKENEFEGFKIKRILLFGHLPQNKSKRETKIIEQLEDNEIEREIKATIETDESSIPHILNTIITFNQEYNVLNKVVTLVIHL